MTIQVAFYKGSGSVFSKLIKIWTRSEYSHTELVIDGNWITSYPSKGVLNRRLQDTSDFNINEWDIITIDQYEYSSVSILYRYLTDQSSCKYDWFGIIFSQFFKIGYNQDDKWFCSELVTKLLQILLVYKVLDLQPNKVSPQKLYEVLL